MLRIFSLASVTASFVPVTLMCGSAENNTPHFSHPSATHTPTYLSTHLRLSGCFPGKPGSAGSPSVFFHHLFRKRIYGQKWYGFFVSDIAIFVLKRDVKLQLTNWHGFS